MSISYLGVELTDLEIRQEGNDVSFVLSGDSGNTEIFINYLPILDDEYSYSDYELILLDNQYLNAESDVFQVYLQKDKVRIGWLFPLSNLESRDNDYYENEHLNKYKFVAFQLLLRASEHEIKINEPNDDFKLSDFYLEEPIILILSKNKTKEIQNFSIEDYLPSLSKYGYYLKNEHKGNSNILAKQAFIEKQRGKTKINLFKSKFKLSDHDFFLELFTKSLKSLDHHLIKFHFLYQVIEFLINKRFEEEFEILLKDFNNKNTTKNDFIERVNEIKKERSNVKHIVKSLDKTGYKDFNEVDLKRDCKLILEQHTVKVKEDLGDLIYDIRNLVTHNYRSIKQDHIEVLDTIIWQLELLVINLFEQTKNE